MMQNRLRHALPCALVLFGCKSTVANDEVAEDGSGSTAETTSDSGSGDSTAESESDTGTGDGDGDCGTETPEQLRNCVDGARYQTDLEFIAQPREPGSEHWMAVQTLCYDRFTEYGLDVELMPYATGTNVVARMDGTETPGEQILIAAHYDHIPDCAGADDNATGTAAVLEAARVLTQRSYPRTVIFACWDEEELGLIGAEAYAAEALMAGDNLLFNYNYEMIGFSDPSPGAQTVPLGLDALFPAQYAELESWEFSGDWIALIVDFEGVPHAEYMAAHATAIGLPHLLLDIPEGAENQPLLADLRRSDHAAFWEAGYPAMMITDTSEFRYAAYHCAGGLEDVVENLDNAFTTQVIRASVGAAAQSLGLAP